MNEIINKQLTERFGKAGLISLATVKNGVPFVRTVDSFYEDGAFYVLTNKLSNKMQQIGDEPLAAISGEWFTAHGRAADLGFFGSSENRQLAKRMREVFAARIDNSHSDLSDENTVILRITLTDGVLLSNGTRYEFDEVEQENRSCPAGFRYAKRSDTPLIFEFIRELAEYERMLPDVVTNERELEEWLFDKRCAEVIFALDGEREVGFALFFHSFSTFLGRAGIYLEDLFVKPEFRGRGYGKGLITRLAQIAVERGYGRLEWSCLKWNTPSIDFYLSLGAVQKEEWTDFRLAGEALKRLGSKADRSDSER